MSSRHLITFAQFLPSPSASILSSLSTPRRSPLPFSCWLTGASSSSVRFVQLNRRNHLSSQRFTTIVAPLYKRPADGTSTYTDIDKRHSETDMDVTHHHNNEQQQQQLSTSEQPYLNPIRMIQPPPSTMPETGQVRVRQHVNPLARKWSQPISLPLNWYGTAFSNVSLPLCVDVGVAKGRFIRKLAARDQNKCNYLGLEIREPLVHQANRLAVEDGLNNLFYVACNANVSFRDVMRSVPTGVLRDVYIQFCDPWFKKQHHKRRLVNQKFVQDLHVVLSESEHSNGQLHHISQPRRVFIQSDVIQVADEMVTLLSEHGGFTRLGTQHGFEKNENGWLVCNPIGIPTEREIAVQNKHGDVYRALFEIRKDIPSV